MQKYLHDLKSWNAVPVEQQEGFVGRTKLSDIELDDATKPSFAHNALTVIEENGQELKIVRANMPFGEVGKGEYGTYFCGYTQLAAQDRADAREHVRRQAARQLRPLAGFQPRR